MSELETLAKSIIRKSLRIQPKESVIVESWNHGSGVATEIIYQLRAAGARPMFLFEDEETYWRGVETLPPTKLGQVSASEWAAISKADAYIFVTGPADIARYRRNLPKSSAATAYNSDWYRRAEKAGLRGARVLLGYVTKERAAAYGFDFDAWWSMIIRAASVDFSAVARKGKKLAALLSKEAEVTVSAPNGTRLAFALKGRPAESDDGIVDAADLKQGNFMTDVPPGYVIVSPDEGSVEGEVRFDLPVPYVGSHLTDVSFRFKDGRASWTAGGAADSLRTQYDKATGAKDRLGWFQIGLNPEAGYGFLQDDFVAGAVEIGIGDNSEYSGKNRSSFGFGGRLSNATVRIGKKVIVDNGHLVV